MANEISKSRRLNLKTGFSGIAAVGFLPSFNRNLALTVNDVFEGTGMTGSVFRYETKNDGSSYEEDGTPDRNTGVTVYTGTLNLVLPILDNATRDQLKLIAYQRPQIFLELYNKKIILLGTETGCELTSFKSNTGGARKDMQGYTLVFAVEESKPWAPVGVTGSTIYNAAINEVGAIQPE